MEATCRMSCPFWKKYKENCPHFIETTWMPHDESQPPKIIRDCAPKRSVLLQLELHSKLESLIKTSNQERNLNHHILTGIYEAIDKHDHMPLNVTPPKKLIELDKTT